MEKLNPDELWSLEKYAQCRSEFRQEVLNHKQARRLSIGPNVSLLFEDRITIRYQVQEMLRVERIFEPQGIAEELAAYNPLIPDGMNWKATMLIQFDDVEERRIALRNLVGIEQRVWVRVEAFPPVYAIADEDLERSTEEKTSAVHFLRFELDSDMGQAMVRGASLSAGIQHSAYQHTIPTVSSDISSSLSADLSF
ncbi:DUF3501 family protein [Gammaproteobacteria bacterium]|nr:DUF3501 family protein [Gammaproteobacteria bacterium]